MNILGLAVATTEHHGASLVVDGIPVACVEEERFNRVKHYGARVGARTDSNLISDPSVQIDDVLCAESIQWVLSHAGMKLSDVDAVAINGLPHALLTQFKGEGELPVHVEGNRYFVPHHRAHAASAYRVSAYGEARVLVMDGRGERNTATCYRSKRNGRLVEVARVEVDSTGRSIGGVYDTASRMLGYGPYGQGAVMALAGRGGEAIRFPEAFGVSEHGEVVANPGLLEEFLRPYRRARGGPLLEVHANLAAGMQDALLEVAVAVAQMGDPSGESLPLCLAGGVALNCPMNTHLARTISNAGVFVQPAAHDAGTALGAALEVAWILGEPTAPRMQSAFLGPEYRDDAVEAALKRSGFSYRRVEDGLEETAQALAEHRVVARFQGRMEFGPRALGNRSLLANPILPETQKRLNRMKGRADWRPFGGIFRGEDCPRYFGVEVDSPFMLFTVDLQENEREKIPVLVHFDGTTRPQIVTSEREPDLHRLVGLFEERTGAAAVVNTSFNRGGEPIVCSPDDALASFRGLGADALHLGSFWVEQ